MLALSLLGLDPSPVWLRLSSVHCYLSQRKQKYLNNIQSGLRGSFTAIKLQVKADPHFSCRNFMKQKATCHSSLVFKLLLYGCHGNLSPTKKL